MKMLTKGEMAAAILKAVPELSVKQKDLKAAEDEVKTLRERIEGYTAQAGEFQAEAERIKAELVKTIAVGQDSGPVQRKARKIREDLADMEVLREATESVLGDKEATLEEARQELGSLFAHAVITAKAEVEAALQKRCAEIEADLKAWGEAVWDVSREVGCNPPPGRHALSIGGHADLHHALGL